MMNGAVFVMNNSVLNIEAGTVIKDTIWAAKAPTWRLLQPPRGGQIFAEGTRGTHHLYGGCGRHNFARRHRYLCAQFVGWRGDLWPERAQRGRGCRRQRTAFWAASMGV
jgi:hypothetical protein